MAVEPSVRGVTRRVMVFLANRRFFVSKIPWKQFRKFYTQKIEPHRVSKIPWKRVRNTVLTSYETRVKYIASKNTVEACQKSSTKTVGPRLRARLERLLCRMGETLGVGFNPKI